MGSTNKFFGDYKNGLGLDLWYEVSPFTATTDRQPQWSTDASKIAKHTRGTGLPIVTSIFGKRGDQSSSEFVISSQTFNNDEYVNDTSLISIIEYLQKWKSTFVDYADFAYLKNLGVYPTNRLMIARRFPSPTVNNLYKIDESPMATMVSWMPEDSDFFKVDYGEVWVDGKESSLEGALNSIGGEFSSPKDGKPGLGTILYGGGKAVSLPGWTEALQIELLNKLGYTDYEANNPPAGNPNLIKESSERFIVSKTGQGTGLTGKFSISFVVEYEQKYINGIDPSFVYMDIIQKALIFGTSKSTFMYNVNPQGGDNKLQSFINKLVRGDIDGMIQALVDFVKSLYDALGGVGGILERVQKSFTEISGVAVQLGTGNVNNINLSQDARNVLGNVISKYRIKLFSVVQALTGAPSGYWHVTIGNPKKPFFSSGDLTTSNVALSFGRVLGYNDLPSTIKIEFTLGSARNLGGQEIMDAFNTGQGRTYLQRKRSYVEVPLGKSNTNDTDETINNGDYKERKKRFDDNLTEVLNDPQNNPGPGIGPTP